MIGRMGYPELEKYLNRLRRSNSRKIVLLDAECVGSEGRKFVKYLKKLNRTALFKIVTVKEGTLFQFFFHAGFFSFEKGLYQIYLVPEQKFDPRMFGKCFGKDPPEKVT